MNGPHTLSFVALAIAAPIALAGELSPPPGAVAPTMKDLDDVEPRTAIRNDFDTLTPIVIQFPGSYYLAEDIQAFFGQHGIEILASNVTLDLNGFRILGNTEVGSLDGIHVDSNAGNTLIANGTVELFFGDGIEGRNDLTLINVRVVNNQETGVNTDRRAIIHRCNATGNGDHGFLAAIGSVAVDCVADGNGLEGFSMASRAAMRGCTALGNEGDGISVGNYSSVLNCSSTGNSSNGFDTAGFTTLSDCVAHDNGQDGFDVNSGGTMTNCVARLNGFHGIDAFASNVLRHNSCTDNVIGNGIDIGGLGNIVEFNVCQGHITEFSAGIQVTGSGNRIDSNHASGNYDGIILDGTENFMIRNTAHANTNFDYGVVGGNNIGAIRDSPSTAGPWDNLEN